MPASAEIIDFQAVRERRKAPKAPAVPPMAQPAFAWVPVWFFGPMWMWLPHASGSRDG